MKMMETFSIQVTGPYRTVCTSFREHEVLLQVCALMNPVVVFLMFYLKNFLIDIQTSKTLPQMDINKMMRMELLHEE